MLLPPSSLDPLLSSLFCPPLLLLLVLLLLLILLHLHFRPDLLPLPSVILPLAILLRKGCAHLPFELLLDLLEEQVMSLLVLVLGVVGVVGYYLGDEAADAGINALGAVGAWSRHCVILPMSMREVADSGKLSDSAELQLK